MISKRFLGKLGFFLMYVVAIWDRAARIVATPLYTLGRRLVIQNCSPEDLLATALRELKKAGIDTSKIKLVTPDQAKEYVADRLMSTLDPSAPRN